MPNRIMPAELIVARHRTIILDVRKQPARLESGETIAGSLHRKPFDAENWWREFEGKRVAVFCVHGHEVSKAVCGFLVDKGVDAAYLTGGFAGWKGAGLPVQPIEAAG